MLHVLVQMQQQWIAARPQRCSVNQWIRYQERVTQRSTASLGAIRVVIQRAAGRIAEEAEQFLSPFHRFLALPLFAGAFGCTLVGSKCILVWLVDRYKRAFQGRVYTSTLRLLALGLVVIAIQFMNDALRIAWPV